MYTYIIVNGKRLGQAVRLRTGASVSMHMPWVKKGISGTRSTCVTAAHLN